MDTSSDRITAPIAEFCRLSGLGRSKIYEMIGDGTLDSITVGKRRLIIVESYRKLIERQRAAPALAASAAPPRRRKTRAPG